MRRVWMGRSLARFVVLEDFDGEVAVGLIEIVDEVGEAAGNESSLCLVQPGGDGSFAFDRVYDFRGAEHDVNVVVAMPVHESVSMRDDVDVEGADLGVLEDQVVVRLGGDLKFGRGLRCEDGGDEQEKDAAFHERDSSSNAEDSNRWSGISGQ